MSSNRRSFEAELYGEHEGRHPSMSDLKDRLSVQIRDVFPNKIAEKPGTAWVDYHSHTKKVAEHGKSYDDATNDEIWFDHDGSDTKPGHWKGWNTAHIKASFHYEDI